MSGNFLLFLFHAGPTHSDYLSCVSSDESVAGDNGRITYQNVHMAHKCVTRLKLMNVSIGTAHFSKFRKTLERR